jgi:D-serine deaminase-like pyridoxal phosphate-dependent protein
MADNAVRKQDIETPALVIDLDALERNMDKIERDLQHSAAKLRPHAKSHKTPEIALKQLERGAVGITCAKMGEAEAMVEGGVDRVLISSELIGASKNRRAAELAKRAEVIVACENEFNVKELAHAARLAGSTPGAIIEADIGNRRCGVRSAEQAVALARIIADEPALRFRGIMGYEGQCVFIKQFDERRQAADKAISTLLEMAHAIENAGIPVEIVSAGGTGTYNITGLFPGVTDIQVGSYILMDARYGSIEGINFEQSLYVLSTVVSRPLSDLAILDYGLKSVPAEFGFASPAPSTYRDGSHNAFGIDGTEVIGLSEEHARLALKNPSRDLKVGDKVDIVPTHCCTTMNTHDRVYVVRGDTVEAIWNITARGKCV